MSTKKRGNTVTETLSCDLASPINVPTAPTETAFEKRRGVSRVEVRRGFAQVHVSDLKGDLAQARLLTLEAIAGAGVSLDFLKLTPDGLSFVVREADADALKEALVGLNVTVDVIPDRHIVMVHAVNMRDEEGLIAQIVLTSISSDAAIDHIGDMHDRTLMVVDARHSDRVQKQVEKVLLGGENAR